MPRKKLPYIPVQMPDKTAAFAGKQFLIENSHSEKKRSKLYPLFRETIRRLVYANFEWDGDITPIEAAALEFKLIETGRVIAVRSIRNDINSVPGGIYFGTFGAPDIIPEKTFQEDGIDSIQLTFDFYGQPSIASCTGLNNVVFTATSDNFVIGYDTMAHTIIDPMTTPVISYIDTLTDVLDNAYGAWRVATETNKHGLVFNVPDETSARIMRKVLEDISDNKPYIILRGNLTQPSNVAFRPTGGNAVSEYYQNLLNAWSLVMDFLGIENDSAQKRERMVVEEAVRNNSLAKSLAYDRLHARQIFAEQVSEKLGKKITVKNAYTAILDNTDVNGNGIQDVSEEDNENG